MRKLLPLLLFLPLISFAKDTYQWHLVDEAVDRSILQVASSVCSLGATPLSSCCSGFLVAPDIVLTNFHCLSCIEASSVVHFDVNTSHVIHDADRGYTSINREDPPETIEVGSILYAYENLDMLLVQLTVPQTGRDIFTLSRQFLENETALLTIGFPFIAPMQVYDDDCQVSNNLGEHFERSHVFDHNCSTTRGSSGSPIIDINSGSVIGIHFSMGQGIQMPAIVEHLEEHAPELFERLLFD